MYIYRYKELVVVKASEADERWGVPYQQGWRLRRDSSIRLIIFFAKVGRTPQFRWPYLFAYMCSVASAFMYCIFSACNLNLCCLFVCLSACLSVSYFFFDTLPLKSLYINLAHSNSQYRTNYSNQHTWQRRRQYKRHYQKHLQEHFH